MSNWTKLVLLVGGALSVSACYGTNRPDIISASGVSDQVSKFQKPKDGLLYQFNMTATAALPAGGIGDPGPVAQRRFMRSGFALIYARCNEYIIGKSDSQRRVNVWRDTFAPITSLATGIIGLADGGKTIDNDILTAIALATNATNAGFKIYEERYLFGAENVNSVRRLVTEALSKDSALALATPDSKLGYEQAVIHLINNQAVCSPAHILELVRDAIDSAKPKAKSGETGASGGTPAAVQNRNEAIALKAMLNRLLTEGKITIEELRNVEAQLAKENATPPPDSGFDTVQTRVAPPDI